MLTSKVCSVCAVRHSRGETARSNESDFPTSQSVPARIAQAPLRETEWEGTQYVPPVSNVHSTTVYIILLAMHF